MALSLRRSSRLAMLFSASRLFPCKAQERLAATRPALALSERDLSSDRRGRERNGGHARALGSLTHWGKAFPAIRPGAATLNTFRTRLSGGSPPPSPIRRLPTGSMAKVPGPFNPVSVARLPSPAYGFLPIPATVVIVPATASTFRTR